MYHKISQEEKSSEYSLAIKHVQLEIVTFSLIIPFWLVVSNIFYFPFHKKGMSSSHWLVQLTPMTSSWGRVCYVYIRDIPVSMPWGFPTFYPPFTHHLATIYPRNRHLSAEFLVFWWPLGFGKSYVAWPKTGVRQEEWLRSTPPGVYIIIYIYIYND